MTSGVERIEVSRLIRADCRRVFAAWTNPEMIVLWWGAGGVRCTAADIDLRVGGHYRIKNETPDGLTMWITGTFSRVEKPIALRYTWATEPVDPATSFSQVDVAFDQQDESTLVTVVHSRIATESDRQVNLHGWSGCLDGLRNLVQGGAEA